MGIYIDMEMPETCKSCYLSKSAPGLYAYVCQPTGILIDYDIAKNKRLKATCPLLPLPAHGRLIDADALEKDVDKYIGGEESRSRFHHWVQVQRTVIPENEEACT